MKVRWIVLGVAIAVVIAAWSALAIGYFFFDPSLAVWTGMVTAAALSLEALLWVAAGVFGWGFLAKRRAALGRFRDRLFGRRQTPAE